MSGRKSSIISRVISPESLKFIRSEMGSEESNLTFKNWHKRMQQEHQLLEQQGRPGFGLWKWCYRACKPCRWFDSCDYNFKICKCCFKFKTFKSLITASLLMALFYLLVFSFVGNEILFGGSMFFLFLLFIAAFLVGYMFYFAGLPPMIGHLVVGIICGNLPENWLPPFEESFLDKATNFFENFALVIALIRSGLLLDISQIKGRVRFIISISAFPLLTEFFFIWGASYVLLELPWDWSALLGSIVGVVSLASVTSVMEKNRQNGYGEDKHLSTVLIAASALEVVYGILLYAICLSYVFTSDEKRKYSALTIIKNASIQISLGLFIGIVCGLLFAFFPDKHDKEAPVLRIAMVGLGSMAMSFLTREYDLDVSGVLGVLTTCLIASNMWEELGWHESSNPVKHFYTKVYYLMQPVALSLVGFSMDFTESDGKDIGLSICVLIIGVTGREVVCFLATLGKQYPTTIKEKAFICIAWFSKGSFQALLAYGVEYYTNQSVKSSDEAKYSEFPKYSTRIKNTTVLGILLTTPFVCYSLTLLTPKLLTKKERSPPVHKQRTDSPTKSLENPRSSVDSEEPKDPG